MSSGACRIERSTGLCFAMASSSVSILMRRAVIAVRHFQASGSTRPLWSRVTWPRFWTWSARGWPRPSTQSLSRTLLQGRLARGHEPPLRSMNQRQRFKPAAKRRLGGEPEPVSEYGCVDPSRKSTDRSSGRRREGRSGCGTCAVNVRPVTHALRSRTRPAMPWSVPAELFSATRQTGAWYRARCWKRFSGACRALPEVRLTAPAIRAFA